MSEHLPGLFNLYTKALGDRGLIFSKRMRVVKAMEEAMLETEEQIVREQESLNCPHQTLKKLSDMMYRQFPAYKEGFRFYRCNECGQMLKAKEAEAHVVEETK